MGRHNVLGPYKMLDAVSMAVSQTSSATNVKHLDKAQIIVDWSGTAPVGEIQIEARQINTNGTIVSPWVPVSFGGTISVSGNTGQHSLLFNELHFAEIRILYVATSGVGTLTAYLISMDKGA